MAADQGGRRRIHVEGAGDWQAHAARNPLAPPPSEPAPPATSQAPAPRLSESEQRDALARSQAEVARRVAAVKGRLVAAREGLPPLITSGLEGAARDVAEATRRAADRVAPCVLWIDEIEKALASGVGDSGTSRRLVGQFLYWLQESTAKVFLVATANDVSSLPPELLRKGRFDEMFFVDLPDRVDREEILSLYFRKLLRTDLGPVLATTLVDLTEGFSGSDIEAVVHDIASHMFAQGTQQLPSEAQIAERFRDVIPYSRSNAEDVAALRAWSSGRCVPAGSPAEGHAYGSQSTRRVVVS